MAEKKLRGNTIKYLPLFRGYQEQYGERVVEEVLKKGKSNAFRLKLPINMKDRMQILHELEKGNPG
jgi:hypothetical protein